MRKYLRDNILNMFPTIIEGIEYIQNATYDNAYKMLCDIDNGFNSILDVLNKNLSEERYLFYKDKISFLQKLLEKINDSKSAEKEFYDTAEKFKNELNTIYKELNDEKEVKFEIVFMPYKASMWDSLESIWRAAKDDSKCDCYVVPIQYFDRNADHSFGAVHYEGSQFPLDVPITSYKEYDIESRKPDAIYIHNPYDDYNIVTSVDPLYYSSELKKNTDMLVYVPYFVVENHIEEHFCYMPGVRNADKVIVQSEKVREVYLKYNPPEKILALGSPKIDKVIYSENHKPEVPKEWRDKINGKKVILYNTHLQYLMNGKGEELFERLKYVFSCFKDRDDVVLLWRPHPLSEATVASMQPQIYGEYKALVKEYKKQKIGIYDDTTDLNRSIAISDAYLGDWSSLVQLYGVTGKPIMIQMVSINKEPTQEEIDSLWFEDAVVDEENMWFAASNLNGLFKMNTATEKTEFLGRFPGEDKDWEWLFKCVIKRGNFLYFIPLQATSFVVYDIKMQKFISYKLPNEILKCDMKFSFVYEAEEFLILFPYKCNYIIKFSLKSGKMEYFNEWYSKIFPYIKNKEDILFKNAVVAKGKVWMPFCQGDYLAEFDLERLDVKLHKLPESHGGYIGIAYSGKDDVFWIAARMKPILIKWNPYTIRSIQYFDLSKNLTIDNQYFGVFENVILHNDTLWILPCCANSIIKINVSNYQIVETEPYPKSFHFLETIRGNWIPRFSGYCINEDSIKLYPARGNQMLEYKFDTGIFVGKKVLASSGDNIKTLSKSPSCFDQNDLFGTPNKSICYENSYRTLTRYIEYVDECGEDYKCNRQSYFQNFIVNGMEECGSKIHLKIINELKNE